jgi:SAM-dependent methyltransferase
MQGDSSPVRGKHCTHWDDVLRHWRHIGPPLAPSPEDIAAYERCAARAASDGRGGLYALLLGVTPQIAASRWPPATTLTAVDHSPAMIEAMWPAPGSPAGSRAIYADWRSMPIDPGTIDVAVGDGCNPVLAFPHDVDAVCAEVARVLRPGGLFVFRVFLRPDEAETVDDIARALAAGRIGTVHVLRWRLVAALCPVTEQGVRLGDVWEVWNGLRGVVARFRQAAGWTADEIATIDMYRNMETRFYFPTLAQMRGAMALHFNETDCICGRYELGERCPILVYAKSA